MAISTYLSIISLNVRELNAPIKRNRVAEWIKKQDPSICCLQETHYSSRHKQTESEQMEKGIPCKWKQKKTEVAIFISDKIDFKAKTVTRDKERRYIMIKKLIQQEDITAVNIYAPNTGALQYIRQC